LVYPDTALLRLVDFFYLYCSFPRFAMRDARSLRRCSQALYLCLCVLGIGLWLTCTAWLPGYAQAQTDSVKAFALTRNQRQMLQKIQTASIIYLGETHDRQADHQAQLAIIQTLYGKNPQMAIALEMFQKPYQAVLDQYLNGTLSEAQLLEQTEYQKRWGFDWSFYAPIVQFARAQQLPVLGINTPTEITRKVGRFGLEALEADDFRWIPPRVDMDLSGESYRKRILETYESFHQGKGNSNSFERFFQAQVLWDETMAEAIAQYWLKSPDRQIVVLVGQGHILFGDGIPSRVARRLKAAGQKDWKQATVLLNPSAETKVQSPRAADFFWVSEDRP
jgi:uncharacterized iron-regulated protein